MTFIPSRHAAITRLDDFLPRAASDYAKSRNYDDGVPSDGFRQNVSQLSPWLHAGLLSEAEVIDRVLSQHSLKTADKFVAEVFWRIYFKGYLEQRPTIWRTYREQRDEAFASLEENSGLAKAYTEAIEGRTGIEAFDRWAQELVETGYLHNHARMWFASIWNFTLKLDWTLGADFFLRHLIDGDAASNTLSWRWVGGLHTKGKTYLARADNIVRYTENQPDGPLAADGLAQEAPALSEDSEHGRQGLHLPEPLGSQDLQEPYALILHDEAASHIPLGLQNPPALVIGAARPDARSTRTVASLASDFASSAVTDGVEAASNDFGCPSRSWSPDQALDDMLKDAGVARIAVPYLPQGWTRDALIPELRPYLEDGVGIEILGELERATWPFAKAGFFGVKKKIESILGEVGITGQSNSDMF